MESSPPYSTMPLCLNMHRKNFAFSPLFITFCGTVNVFTVGLCFAGLNKTTWAVTSASTYLDRTVATDIRLHMTEK